MNLVMRSRLDYEVKNLVLYLIKLVLNEILLSFSYLDHQPFSLVILIPTRFGDSANNIIPSMKMVQKVSLSDPLKRFNWEKSKSSPMK